MCPDRLDSRDSVRLQTCSDRTGSGTAPAVPVLGYNGPPFLPALPFRTGPVDSRTGPDRPARIARLTAESAP